MHKDDGNHKDWCKHTRNSAYGKAGVNRKNRRAADIEIKRDNDESLRRNRR